eukprot:3291464-Lingulodinium_polyedra.AAC.1
MSFLSFASASSSSAFEVPLAALLPTALLRAIGAQGQEQRASSCLRPKWLRTLAVWTVHVLIGAEGQEQWCPT